MGSCRFYSLIIFAREKNNYGDDCFVIKAILKMIILKLIIWRLWWVIIIWK